MANPSSKIGRTTVIVGSVRGSGDVEIEGRIEGIVDVEGDVALLDSARVRIDEGALAGRAVTIRGAVAGGIRGGASIVLEEGARVVGDLVAPTIGIRPGGLLRGHVTTSDAPAAPARAERNAKSRAVATPAPRAVRPYAVPAARNERATPVVTQRTPQEEVEVATPAPQGRGKRDAAPAPVMPALRKGQRGQMKRKNGK